MRYRFRISFTVLIFAVLVLSVGWAQPPPETVPVRGSVVDEKTKEPVAKARVRFRPVETTGRSGASTAANDQGQFTVELAEGEYELVVQAKGYRPHSQPVKVTPNNPSLQISLTPLPALRGRILRPDGLPLAGTNLISKRRLNFPEGGVGEWVDVVTTDAVGRYRASIEGSGQLYLRVIARGIGYAQAGPWEVAGEDVDGGDLVLQPAASVSGVVTAQTTGEPVEGARVEAEWWSPWGRDGRDRVDSVATDAQGRFTLPDLPGGRYNLRFSAPDFLRISSPLRLRDGQNREDFNVSLPPPVTLTVQLLGPDGLPLAHQEVQGLVGMQEGSRPGLRSREDLITTDAEGRFSIKLDDVGFGSLSLFQPDLGIAFLRFPARQGEDLHREVKMQPSSTLRGTVRDQRTKNPIAGAQVQASLQSPWGFSQLVGSPATLTDEQGVFELADLAPGDWNLSVQKAGFRNHRQRVALLVGREALEVVMEMQRARTYTLRGQVLDGKGGPLAGAWVRIGNEEQRTDAEGRFAFQGRSNPASFLEVEAPGWARIRKWIWPDPEKEEQEVPVVVRYHGGTLAGRVRREGSGTPVEGALVIPWDAYTSESPRRYWEDPETWEDPASRRRARERLRRFPHAFTDEQGRFRIENVGEGEYLLHILGAGLQPTLHPGVEVIEGGATELELEARPRTAPPPSRAASPEGTATLAGRLLTPEGKPLEYTEVFWMLQMRSRDGESTRSGTTQTDEQGHFTIDSNTARSRSFFGGGIRFPATADLTLFVEGFHPVEFRGLEVEKEGEAPFLEASLEEPRKGGVIGQVLLPDGHTPGSGLHVIPFTKNRIFPPTQGERANSHYGTGGDTFHFASRLTVTTDQEGFFHLEGFWPGEYGLFITPWTNPESLRPPLPPEDPLNQVAFPRIQMVQIPEGQNRELEITLMSTGSLAGTAIDAAGQPLAGVEVSASPAPGAFFGGRPETVTTDPQGRFILPGLAPGQYRVNGSREGYQGVPSRKIEVPAGGQVEGVRVQLFPLSLATLEGQVVQPDGGPVENARLFLLSWPGGQVQPRTEATSDAEGRFTLENVYPGKYRIAATKVGWAGGESDPLKLPPGARLTGLTIPLQEGGIVRGQVLDAAGQPAAGVMVAAAPEHHDVRNFEPLSGWPFPFLTRQTRTDEEGRFELRRVLPGDTQVFVFTETPGSGIRSGMFRGLIRDGQRKVKVQSGESTGPVTLRLWPTEGVIRGTVTQEDGTPLENVTVRPYNHFLSRWTMRAQTDGQGKFQIAGLPSGTYHVYAEAEGWAGRSLQDLVLAPEKPQAEVALTLSKGGTIQGQVVDTRGQPVGGVQVMTGTQRGDGMPENGLTQSSGRTDADGVFILPHLAAGEYELTCRGWDLTEKKVVAVVKEGETTLVKVVMGEE